MRSASPSIRRRRRWHSADPFRAGHIPTTGDVGPITTCRTGLGRCLTFEHDPSVSRRPLGWPSTPPSWSRSGSRSSRSRSVCTRSGVARACTCSARARSCWQAPPSRGWSRSRSGAPARASVASVRSPMRRPRSSGPRTPPAGSPMSATPGGVPPAERFPRRSAGGGWTRSPRRTVAPCFGRSGVPFATACRSIATSASPRHGAACGGCDAIGEARAAVGGDGLAGAFVDITARAGQEDAARASGARGRTCGARARRRGRRAHLVDADRHRRRRAGWAAGPRQRSVPLARRRRATTTSSRRAPRSAIGPRNSGNGWRRSTAVPAPREVSRSSWSSSRPTAPTSRWPSRSRP